MARKLFCQLSPTTYRISRRKNILLRRLRDLPLLPRLVRARTSEPLPVVICRHNSLIRRRLGQVDMRLQENKAVNLALAAPKIDGILIRPGEIFSFWRLVGDCTAQKGFREGLTISMSQPSSGIGGGLCQLTNLLHWMILHSDLTIIEHHHHDQIDLFPDYNRQIPFGTGTSICYNYLDYRFRNDTDRTYQLLVHTTDTHLRGELRADRPQACAYHIDLRYERFVREQGEVYRCGEIWRRQVDKRTGNLTGETLLRRNHARVCYDTSHLEICEEKII